MAFTAQPLFPGMIYDSAVRLAAAASEPGVTQATRQADDRRVWAMAREMGWTSLMAGEDAGGIEGTLYDMAAVVDGLARHDVFMPVIERCAVVPLLLRLAGDTPACGRLLRDICVGAADVALLSAGDATYVRGCPAVTARALSDGRYRLHGASLQSMGGMEATHYLIVAELQETGQADRSVLLQIEAGQIVNALALFDTVDDVALTTLDVSHLDAIQAVQLAGGEQVRSLQATMHSISALLVCVDSLAALGVLLEQSVAHLNTRIQFGVPLASFQSLRHKAVDVFVMYETAKGLVMHACAKAQEHPQEAARDIQLAKYYVGRVSRRAAETAIQLHGAMGMSQELAAARLAKRIITNDFRFGDRLYHGARLCTTLPAHVAAMGVSHA
jgi:alkylation response protein AidB-like acyl-CoA dehydrogenase